MKHSSLLLLMWLATWSFGQEKPIVVVELFTSEGCSSCPPADRLLSSIINENHESVEVIALSFHVDYWNYIGWKDPYSDARFSKRQRNYARQLISSVYTPQMVVNGAIQFVGSDRSSWKKTLAEEKNDARVGTLTITEKSLENHRLNLTVGAFTPGNVINVAVVERNLAQNVNRGENRGSVLTHDNVVRAFSSSVQEDQISRFELTLPDDLDLTKSSVVVYSQDQTNLEINGAKKIALSSLQ